jgi:hypothetical protein
MISAFTVQHYEHATDRSFEEVVSAFEAATGSVEKGELKLVSARKLDEKLRLLAERSTAAKA